MATGKALDGKLVVLLGGSGFVGSPLAQALLARAARIRIACRHPERAFRLKPLAKLGQIQFVRCDVTRPRSLAAALSGAGAVVNLAAAWGDKGHAVMAEGAGNAAAAARDAGIADFVQISSIGADRAGATHFARDKAEGEARVLAALPGATILRPSVIFGEDDKFLAMFARAIAAFPVMPVFAPESLLQIVWVDDVAAAVAAVLQDREQSAGKIYELAGPERLSVIEINRRIARAQGRERLLLPLPDALSAAIAALPLSPLTLDQWKMLKAGNVASGTLPGFGALGIAPKPLELFLERWMIRYRKHGRFGAKLAA
jgi:NADH dehydrogenase